MFGGYFKQMFCLFSPLTPESRGTEVEEENYTFSCFLSSSIASATLPAVRKNVFFKPLKLRYIIPPTVEKTPPIIVKIPPRERPTLGSLSSKVANPVCTMIIPAMSTSIPDIINENEMIFVFVVFAILSCLHNGIIIPTD